MTALIKFFTSGSRGTGNSDLDSHLLADLGLSRLVMEYTSTDQSPARSSQQGSNHRHSCNNTGDVAV